MGSQTVSVREHILESLRGRSLRIPDLETPLACWPQYVSPYLERLRQDVDETLQTLFPAADERLQKIRHADVGLFGASWYPYAPYEALKMVTFLTLWVSPHL